MPILQYDADSQAALIDVRKQAEQGNHNLLHLYVLNGSRVNALQMIERRLNIAKQGQGSLILIGGVSGIGKTSLALTAEAWAKAEGAIFNLGRCYHQGATPFLLWQESLTAMNNSVELNLESLPEPFGHAAPAQSAYQLAQMITTQLQTAAAKQPIILLLDDIHWADPDSLDLLELVTRNLTQNAIVIIATYRSENVNRDHPLYQLFPTLQRNRPVESIHLRPLTLEDTHRVVEGYHGPSSLALARYLHHRADGHPLFLVELLSDLIDQNLLSQNQDGEWLPPDQSVSIPTLLQQVIIHRVTLLGEQAETFLTVAAVVGESWHLSIVEALLEWPEGTLLDILRKALAIRIIVVDDTRSERYRFAHGLVREVLYYQLLIRQRKQLHVQIAVQLEHQSLTDPATLAYHFYEAEQWEKAYQYNLEAADTVRHCFASQSTLQFYRQALDSLQKVVTDPAPERLISLYEKIGKNHAALNQKIRATEAYTQMGEYARAINDKHAEGRALFWLAWNQVRAYQTDDADTSREAAIRLAEELNDPHLLALNNFNYGSNYLLAGKLGQAKHYLDQAEAYTRLSNKQDLLSNILTYHGLVDIWLGQYAAGGQSIREGLSLALAEQSVFDHIRTLCWLGLAQLEQGQYLQARASLKKGLSLIDELQENRLLQSRLMNILAYLYREVGDIEQSLLNGQQALDAVRRDGDYSNIEPACYAMLELATTYLHAGQLETVKSYIQEFETIFDRHEYGRFRYMNRYQLLLTELALVQDQFDQALEYASAALQEAKSKGVRKNITKCLLYEGQALLGLGRTEEAVDRLRQATELADEIAHGSLRWQTRLHLAKAQAIQGQANVVLYEQALSQVETITYQLTDERLRQCFLALPLVEELKTSALTPLTTPHATAQKPPASTSKYPAGLTRREVEVLRLVAQGMTNRQIAEKLHISVRTVNTHLTNILNKTTSGNRTAAAAFAIQHRLI